MKSLIFVLIAIVAITVLADAQIAPIQSNPVFMKVGLELKERYEGQLRDISMQVDDIFFMIVKDSIVTKDEMVNLEDAIDKFASIKKTFDRDLTEYNLHTSTGIDSMYVKITDIYFATVNRMWYKDNDTQDVRNLIDARVGYDVHILRGDSYSIWKWGLDTFLSLAIAGLAVSIRRDNGKKENNWRFTGEAFSISLTIISLLFFVVI